MHCRMTKISLVTIFILIGCAGLSLGRGDGGQQNWPQQDYNMKGGQTKGPLGGWDDEPSNPWGGGQGGYKLEDSIPGIPGQSYPNFDKIPETSFDCRRQKNPGYYGDVESQCQVFHICQAGGRQNSFLCPIGTIFNQESFVCDWWFNVNCGESPIHYDRNENLFRGSDIGIDGNKIKKKGQQGNSKGSDIPSTVGIPSWGTQGGNDNFGMKGPMNQDGQQGPWRSQGGANKPQGRPNVGGRGGQNKGSSRNNVGGNWQNTGNQGGQNKGSSMGSAGGNWQNSRNQAGQNRGADRDNVGGGNWQNSGNQGGQNKGASRGNVGGGNWQNSGSQGAQNKGAGRGNVGGGNWQNSGSQGGQKGFGMTGNMNPQWNNEGNIPGRNKGINNQIRQGRGGQKGAMLGGNNKMQRRIGFPPNEGANRQGQKGQVGVGNFGMGNKRTRGQGTKGSAGRSGSISANSWSMGSQNFQLSFNEKGNNFPNNPNSGDGPSPLQDNNSWQGPNNNQPEGHFKGEDGNRNWKNEGADFNQWGSRISNFQPEFENNNVGGRGDNWKPEYDEDNVDSFHFNDKGIFEGQAGENDYDYAWNS